MKINLNEVATGDLFRLLKEIAQELEARNSRPVVERVQDQRPVVTLRVPAESDADFVLAIAARMKSGGYVKAGERQRVAEIAENYGPWVRQQGLPITHNAGDWQRAGQWSSALRARAK